jgi:hypothetical protein
MAARETACGEPGTPDYAVPSDGFQRVLRAGRGETAARWEQWREHQLVSADEPSEKTAGKKEDSSHGSLGRADRFAPREELRSERIEAGGIGLTANPDDQVPRRLERLDLAAPDLPQPAP